MPRHNYIQYFGSSNGGCKIVMRFEASAGPPLILVAPMVLPEWGLQNYDPPLNCEMQVMLFTGYRPRGNFEPNAQRHSTQQLQVDRQF